MEYLLYSPLGTGWELFAFIAIVATYCVMDYAKQSKPKRSKRTERQIFDNYNEVDRMLITAVFNDKFKTIDHNNQVRIFRFIGDGYK